MTAKTATKETKTMTDKTSTKTAPAAKTVIASRTVTVKGKTALEAGKAAMAAIDFKGLAKEASAKLKAAKAQKSDKAAPAPKAKATKEREETISDDAKLVVLVKENPRKGKLAAKTFGFMMKCKTVGEWRRMCEEQGGDKGYLHSNIRKGYIAVK